VEEYKADGTWINDVGFKGTWRIMNGQLVLSHWLLGTQKRDFALTKNTLKIADKNNKLNSEYAHSYRRKN
jgi:hypothetical protein